MFRDRDESREGLCSPRTLPRPGLHGGAKGSRGSAAAWRRSKSPVSRPHLSLLLCPEFDDSFSGGGAGSGYSSPSSPSGSPALGRRFPPSSSLPRPHALARARGADLYTTSLPCSPTLGRLGREPVSREASLPASPLPRIHIVHCDQVKTTQVSQDCRSG
jgi:hypothetical protein